MGEEQQLSLFDDKGRVINTLTEEMNKFAEKLTNKSTKRNFLRSPKGRDKFLSAFNSYTESQQNDILNSFNKGKMKWNDMRQIVEGNAYAKSLEEQWGSPIKKVEHSPLFKADDYIGKQQNLINPNYAEIKRNIKENVNSSANSRPSSNFSTYIKKENDINNSTQNTAQQINVKPKRAVLEGPSGEAQSSEDLSRKVANGASVEEDMAQDAKVESKRLNEKLSKSMGESATGVYQEPEPSEPSAPERINTDNVEPTASKPASNTEIPEKDGAVKTRAERNKRILENKNISIKGLTEDEIQQRVRALAMERKKSLSNIGGIKSSGHGKLAMAVGAVVSTGALVHALSDSRGQQSNAQLYGQQPIQY